ncbi:uncharacterized protein BX663DRAFT_73259 [Cokeromyces recurvatus]|uniref:uncharacterized protein n=1 Tax=Cokeromyces recurvatus TaxID=90255 RepID=UPI0022205E6D|nr:uncharacterized protein BX663DRAFT_73259 [Cokeromyces recurvatus]KAI7902352.1 hypothetical protein BX663DRAFT_73259 [Cokeromyces recurvatus]
MGKKRKTLSFFFFFISFPPFFLFIKKKMSLINISNDDGEAIVGILNKKTMDKIILFVHGEQGHKDSLYQVDLADSLPLSTFRFDLHGHGDSEGKTGYDHIKKNTKDIFVVANYFENLGYDIFAIIAYGKGTIIGYILYLYNENI